MRFAVLQMKMSADPEENISNALSYMKQAASQKAEWILLPELVHILYPGQTQDQALFDFAIPPESGLFDPIRDFASTTGISIALPFFEKRMSGVYSNSMMHLSAKTPSDRIYRKAHIPHDPGFSEKYYFTPGEEGFQVWNKQTFPISPLICWDQWFPEAARISALKGAELILYPTAIGWLPEETEEDRATMLDAWITIQRSHAIANGLFVAVANRCGYEPSPENPETGIEFWGNSFICSPSGKVLAQAGSEETLLYADLDRGDVETTRRSWPFLRDRRIDLYAPLLQRHD